MLYMISFLKGLYHEIRVDSFKGVFVTRNSAAFPVHYPLQKIKKKRKKKNLLLTMSL